MLYNEIILEGGRYMHRVCSLFKSRRNTDDWPFVCPYCLQVQVFNTHLMIIITAPTATDKSMH
jgi:hypothetical protein